MSVGLVAEFLSPWASDLFLAQAFGEMWPTAPFYCLGHQRGQLGAPIETRPVHSTYFTRLSSGQHPPRWAKALIPAAWKGLGEIAEDQVIVVSNGLAQGASGGKKRLIYFYDYRPAEGWPFRPYLRSWQKMSVRPDDTVVASGQAMARLLRQDGLRVDHIVPAFIKHTDLPALQSGPKKDSLLVFSDPFSLQHLPAMAQACQSLGKNMVVIGLRPRTDLGAHVEIYEKIAVEDFSRLMGKAHAVVDLGQGAFPRRALMAMAMGRPFVVFDTLTNREFLSEEHGAFVQGHLHETLQEILERGPSFSSAAAHRASLRFTEVRFKRKMTKIVQEMSAAH